MIEKLWLNILKANTVTPPIGRRPANLAAKKSFTNCGPPSPLHTAIRKLTSLYAGWLTLWHQYIGKTGVLDKAKKLLPRGHHGIKEPLGYLTPANLPQPTATIGAPCWNSNNLEKPPTISWKETFLPPAVTTTSSGNPPEDTKKGTLSLYNQSSPPRRTQVLHNTSNFLNVAGVSLSPPR